MLFSSLRPPSLGPGLGDLERKGGREAVYLWGSGGGRVGVLGATNFNRTTDPPALCLSARSLGELLQWLRRCRPGLSELQIQGAEPHREHLPPSVNGPTENLLVMGLSLWLPPPLTTFPSPPGVC